MKNKNIYIFVLCSIILLGILQIKIVKQTNILKEGLQDKNFVILLGDSIFQNEGYVKDENTIENKLKNKINSLVLAKDDSLIEDVISQYNEIPEELNEPNTYLFISIGGNDLLGYYVTNQYNSDDLSKFNIVWDKYVREINKIINKTKCTVVLTDLYYVHENTYHKYYNIIDAWNNNLERFSKKKNILLYKISELVKREKDYVNIIEPSKYGSQIIVDNIVNFNS